MTQEPLDSILSRGGEAAPAQDQATQAETVTQATTENQSSQSTEAATTDGQQDQKMVPQEALHAERQKVKRYTEEVAEFRKSNETLQRQVAELLQRVPIPQQQQSQAPDIFADPDRYFQDRLKPLVQHIGAMSETVSRRFAVAEHGSDTVDAAYEALEKGVQSDPSIQFEWQRIMGSGDPWGELVRWHKRTQALNEIGSDPDAYKAKVKAEILAEMQQGGGQQQAQQAPVVMPSNFAGARNVGARTGPAWSGPPAIADIFNRKRTPA